MNRGDAFLMPLPRQPTNHHLWFVISDPIANGGTFIIVNLTTDEVRAGRECVLTPGDHEWIRETCFVTFGDALEITPALSENIDKLIGTKVLMQGPLRNDVLERIVNAAKCSTAIPVSFKRYL